MTRHILAIVALVFCAQSAWAVDIKVDVNDIAAPGNTQLGFDTINRNDGGANAATRTFSNGVTLDIDAAGFTLGDNDRIRATPVNGGGLTQAAIYQDFIFAPQDAGGTGPQRGLDANFSNLTPGKLYNVTVHSFDTGSTGTRTSDWGARGFGTSIDNYQFNGAVSPANDADNQFSFEAFADLSGNLTIQGRQNAAAASPQVFINAIQLEERQATLVENGRVFAIDIDSTQGGTPLNTAPGFTSLNVGGGAAGAVVVDGTTFTTFSADGSRNRTGGSNPLTNDFIFDDGAGQASGLIINDLPDGVYQAEVFSFDQAAAAGDQIVGITEFVANGETIFGTNFASNANTPFTFVFDSSQFADGFGIFTRENNGANRSRFNALRLTELNVIPEPTTGLLALMGMAGLAVRRRRAA